MGVDKAVGARKHAQELGIETLALVREVVGEPTAQQPRETVEEMAVGESDDATIDVEQPVEGEPGAPVVVARDGVDGRDGLEARQDGDFAHIAGVQDEVNASQVRSRFA
jgi:hypothetical protein